MSVFTGSRPGSEFGGWLISVLGISVVSSPVFAQDDADALAAARACSSIEDDAERLDCLEAALGVVSPVDEESLPVTSRQTGGGRNAPPAVEQAADASFDDEPEDESDNESDEASEPEQQTIRIVEIQRSPLGATTFVTDSGERWVQGNAAAGRYPATPFDAVLVPAMRDSFFLVSPIGGPRVRVSLAR